MPSIIRLTDRSRYVVGLGSCKRERYLEYHAGPSGYGIRLKSVSMPQVRGIYAHVGIAYLLATVQEQDALPTEGQIREGARLAVDAYVAVVEARGMRQLDGSDRVEIVIQEQAALLVGVTWVFALEILPWLHATYRIIDVEREEIAVLDCTCGLGDLIGTVEDHERRDCAGLGWQSKADAILEKRATGMLEYWELKTTGYEKRAEDYETTIQMAAGVLGAEQRLERRIDACGVINLIVGKREHTYNYETKQKDGPLRQQSVLCYGYRQPPQAPGQVEDWQPEYDYVDDAGRNRRLNKTYQKAPIWEIDPRLSAGLDPAEFWVKWIGAALRGKQAKIIGPIERPSVVLEGFTREVVYEERRWSQDLWTVYEVTEQYGWGSPEWEACLDELFPRSWQCRRYGSRYECQFLNVCLKRQGWDDPLQNGYQLRRPHHLPEVLQAEARGIELPADEGEGED